MEKERRNLLGLMEWTLKLRELPKNSAEFNEAMDALEKKDRRRDAKK